MDNVQGVLTLTNAKLEIGNKATDYTQAPEDIVLDYTTKDNVISQSLTQYQATNDGKVTKAQSDATQALGLVATKVSQTTFDTKTGDLDSKYTAVKQTADQASTDIVAIKSTNTKQDARMTTIESDANGTKTTVSNLQTDLGKANGSITTLQQRADGFDATVTKVNTQLNDLSQVNMVVNSEFSPNLAGWYIRGTQTLLSDGPNSSDVGFNKSGHVVLDTTNGTGTGNVNYTSMAYPVTPSSIISVSVELKASVSGTNPQIGFIYYDANMNAVAGQRGGVPVTTDYKLWKYTGTAIPATAKYVSFDILISNVYKAKYVMSQPMMVIGSPVGAYVAGQYNNNGATAKAQLTADQATTSLNNYRSDADGRISKAQADIIVNANAITQKVSQSDYNAKTGDLTTKVNTAQSTADSATSTIGSYKTSNDARVASAESKITANATAITSKVSQSDYNTKTGQIDGQISTINQTAGKISQSVSDVKAQVDGLSVGGRNLYLNSKGLADSYGGAGTITVEPFDSTTNMWHVVSPKGQGLAGIYLWDYGNGKIPDNSDWAYSADVKGTITPFAFGIEAGSHNPVVGTVGSDWSRISQTGRVDSGTRKTPVMYFDSNLGPVDVYIKLPKLENGNMPTSWSPAPEDVDNKISTVSQTVDSISSIVSDPTTGLTKRVQTAEGTLSQVTGADIPALQKATYWQPYGSLDFNSYTKQGSFFFNTTSAKTNGPTSSTAWTYLMVEQGTADNGRIKQTAWYDGVTGVKITYVRTLNSGTWSPWYANDNDSVATIAQTNGAIQTEISNRQTGDANTLTQAKDFTTSSISNSESGMRSQITQTSDAILGKVGAVNLFPNSEFEKDYGYRDKNGSVTTLSLAQKNDIDGRLNGTVTVVSDAAAWQGYWARNIPVYGGQSYSASVLVHYTNGGLSNGYALLDVWFVDKDGNRISTGTIGTGGSNNSATGQVSSPWWVKLYIENLIAPTNAVNMQVSLLVNNAGAGQTAMFTQPMVTATEKLQHYTPNNDITTQLALLKDNWSIGIADNAGAITSGIVGNSSNMSLISNNVTINSPQTQIKGTAWINSAMIGNGQIGKAQIGDASIDTAKIASLDVAKLTGNVSNFIQSNWNGIYSSVAIDGSGMKITTGGTVTTLDQWGTHWSRGNLNSLYGFGYWQDSSGKNTSSTGLYMGVTGSENAFINILGTNGNAAAVLAGSQFDHGSNTNIAPGAFNFFTNVNIRTQLAFKGNMYNSPSYIESNELTRTLNFFTGGGSQGGGNYFYFNQNVLSAGTFSSTSRLSQKIVDSPYTEDALGEISKTQLVNFAYKNRPDQNHVSPIIDDVNDTKEYYIPKTIVGQNGEYVDMYTMISMAWKALQQVNDRLEKLESR